MLQAPVRVGAALLGCALAASAPAAQTIDDASVGAACGELDRAAAEGKVPLVEVIACANREAARQLNAQMPMRVDELTIVESIGAVGPELVYNVRLDVAAAGVSGEARSRLADNTRGFVCAAADMSRTVANGGRYRYRWSDRSGAFIHETLIDRC